MSLSGVKAMARPRSTDTAPVAEAREALESAIHEVEHGLGGTDAVTDAVSDLFAAENAVTA